MIDTLELLYSSTMLSISSPDGPPPIYGEVGEGSFLQRAEGEAELQAWIDDNLLGNVKGVGNIRICHII